MKERRGNGGTASRGWIMLAGALLFGAVVVANVFAVLLGWVGCAGTDVSESPPPGSFGDALCSSAPVGVLGIVLAGISLLAPLVFAGAAVRQRSWWPLLLGVVVSTAAVAPLTIGASIVIGSNSVEALLVGLPLFILFVALAALFATRPGNVSRGTQ